MKGIFTEGGLEKYIKDDSDSLDNLISIMNISSEKFKRVITTLRLEKGHEITGEWDLSKIRAMMIERPAFMSEVCHLLREGANDPKYQSMIPKFYLENFVIDSSTMARLSNPDDLRRLIKKGIEGKYPFFKSVDLSIDLSIQRRDNTGRGRYWKKVYYFNGQPYILTSQWYEESKKSFIEWYNALISNDKA